MTFLRVLLVRHGQSSNNALMEDGGIGEFMKKRLPDAPLTALGRRQALVLAAALASSQDSHPPITAVYTSAMARALGTADAIGAALGMPAIVWAALHEVGGCYTQETTSDSSELRLVGFRGLTASEIRTTYQALVPENCGVNEHGWWTGPSAEHHRDAQKRIRDILATLRARADALGARGEERVLCPLRSTDFLHELRRTAALGPRVPGPAAALPDGTTAPAAASPLSSLHGFAALWNEVKQSKKPTAAGAASGISAVDGMEQSAVLRHGSAQAAQALRTQHQRCETIALVCHGDMIDSLLKLALGVGGEGGAASTSHDTGDSGTHDSRVLFCVANCAVSCLDFMPGNTIRVIRINDVRHLVGAAAAAAGDAPVADVGAAVAHGNGSVRGESLITGTPR